MFEVGIKTSFSAAHHLCGYPGSCADQHGHNWEVEVFLKGETLDETGMLVDFRILKERVRAIIEQLDHKDLSLLEQFAGLNPTSENIARHIYERVDAESADSDYGVSRVIVKETRDTTAVYYKGNKQ